MRRPKPGFPLVLSLVSIVLAVQVVLLARENRALKAARTEEVEASEGLPAPSPPARFEPGEFMEPFDLVGEGGAAHRVGFDGEFESLLLFVYSRGCSICPTMLPVWNELSAQLAPPVSVVGIQLDGLGALEEGIPAWNDLAFHRYELVDSLQVPLAKMTRVPLTLVVDAGGLVTWVRYGLLDEGARSELRSLLQLE